MARVPAKWGKMLLTWGVLQGIHSPSEAADGFVRTRTIKKEIEAGFIRHRLLPNNEIRRGKAVSPLRKLPQPGTQRWDEGGRSSVAALDLPFAS